MSKHFWNCFVFFVYFLQDISFKAVTVLSGKSQSDLKWAPLIRDRFVSCFLHSVKENCHSSTSKIKTITGSQIHAFIQLLKWNFHSGISSAETRTCFFQNAPSIFCKGSSPRFCSKRPIFPYSFIPMPRVKGEGQYMAIFFNSMMNLVSMYVENKAA